MAVTVVEIVGQGTLAAAGGSSKAIVNVFHLFRNLVGGAFTKANVITAFQTAIQTPWLLACSSRYTLNDLLIRQLDDATDPYLLSAVGTPGAVAGDTLPSLTTVYMYYKPGIRLKAARGNKKFAGIPEAQTTGDVLTGTGLTLWGNLATALQTAFNDSDGNQWVPTVISRKPPANYKTNPTTIVNYNTAQVLLNTRIGRLKRREVKSVY